MARIHVQAWRETYSAHFPDDYFGEPMLEQRRRMWHRAIDEDDPSHRVRVAELDGRAVGIALAGPSLGDEAARELQLYVIYVLAEAHGTGVGQELLEAVLGDEPAQLWVAEDNPRAIAFYARNGFHPDGATQTADRGVTGFPPLTEIRLVRPSA